MSYVRKLMAHDEKLVGIARLHWIYVLKGILWFAVMAGLGWIFNAAMTRVMFTIGESLNSQFLPTLLAGASSGVMYFLMGGGFLVFLFLVIDVLTTEIGLSDRRVMHKRGLIFVKTRQIDIEEIRGENLDLGYFGRILGYGYIMLDCRFLGDVRLPAIEAPERFMRALHTARAEAQDSLSVVMGKGNVKTPVQLVNPDAAMGGIEPPPPQPDIQPGQPTPQPEVQPQTPQPEIRPEPTPHAPPPPSQPPNQPIQPVPQQPTPNPGPNPQPPLQPPTTAAIDPQVVAEVMKQVMPQMTEQIVQQLEEKGMINKPSPESNNEIDNDLVTVFDDARLKDPDPHDLHDKLEHVIH